MANATIAATAAAPAIAPTAIQRLRFEDVLTGAGCVDAFTAFATVLGGFDLLTTPRATESCIAPGTAAVAAPAGLGAGTAAAAARTS